MEGGALAGLQPPVPAVGVGPQGDGQAQPTQHGEALPQVGGPGGAVLLVPLGLGLRWDALTAVGLAAVIVALWQRPAAVAGRSARPDLLLRLGEASFGVYLCWVFIEIALVGALRVIEPGPGGRVLLMAAGFAANLAAGWLAWRLVEVPAHRWVLDRAEPRAKLDQACPAAR